MPKLLDPTILDNLIPLTETLAPKPNESYEIRRTKDAQVNELITPILKETITYFKNNPNITTYREAYQSGENPKLNTVLSANKTATDGFQYIDATFNLLLDAENFEPYEFRTTCEDSDLDVAPVINQAFNDLPTYKHQLVDTIDKALTKITTNWESTESKANLAQELATDQFLYQHYDEVKSSKVVDDYVRKHIESNNLRQLLLNYLRSFKTLTKLKEEI